MSEERFGFICWWYGRIERLYLLYFMIDIEDILGRKEGRKISFLQVGWLRGGWMDDTNNSLFGRSRRARS